MTPAIDPPQCPKCGSTQAALCAQSVEYGPEEWAGQPLKERELRTLAYQCECGMAFTQTERGDLPPDRSMAVGS
jgi:hypothetical protein